MKKYDFMRMIVFFDLPVKTKENKKNYVVFRKYLLEKGFFMIQYSIYTKILFNRDQGVHLRESLKRNVPDNGNVRIMLVTEKQYSRMEVIIGGISNQEEKITNDIFIKL